MKVDPNLASATLLAQLVLHFDGTEGLDRAGFFFQPIPNGPSMAQILASCFWSGSLLYSIITATIGILVKQWLQKYLHNSCSSPEEWVRVRQARHAALLQWKMFDLGAILPLLLQAAMGLFLAGLGIFLFEINRIVFWVIWIGGALYISGWAFLALAPVISTTCPYHFTFHFEFLDYLRTVFTQLTRGSDWRQRLGYTNPFYRFPGDERGVRREPHLDVQAVLSADTHIREQF